MKNIFYDMQKKNYPIQKVISAAILLTTIVMTRDSHALSFAGGMSISSRYFQAEKILPDGFAFGLGGKLHLPAGKHLRFGGMGFTDKCSYKQSGISGSYFSLGMGGVTAEYQYRLSHINVACGFLIGGGSLTSLHLLSKNSQDTISGIFSKNSGMIFSPLLTVEFPLKAHLVCMLMLQWIEGAGALSALHGPSLKFGILFQR